MSDEQLLRFPRLRNHDMVVLRDMILEDSSSVTPATTHQNQVYAPIGGPKVTETHLNEVRTSALTTVARIRRQHDAKEASLPWKMHFDIAVGRALHRSLRISRTEAAAKGFWAWLALVLLPDVVPHRESDFAANRVEGGRRNVFRIGWWPAEVLGDLHDEDPASMNVDEIVGLFERPGVSRDNDLAREYAAELRRHSPEGRAGITREFSKSVRRRGAHTSFAVAGYEALPELFAEAEKLAAEEPEQAESVDAASPPALSADIPAAIETGDSTIPFAVPRSDDVNQPAGRLDWHKLPVAKEVGEPTALIIEEERVPLVADGQTSARGRPKYRCSATLRNGATVTATLVRRAAEFGVNVKIGAG